MIILKKIKKKIIYNLTKKPECYIHVDKPRTLQEHRQVQFNNWSKYYGVYSGSYLPKDPNKLTKEGKKGWYEIKGKSDKTIRNFKRKSSGQIVNFHKENADQIDHYHWENPNLTIKQGSHKIKTSFLDRYGNPFTKKDPAHHLAPLDKDCPKNALKRYLR